MTKIRHVSTQSEIDSLINNNIIHTVVYDSISAEVYLRGNLNIRKKNFLLKFVQYFVPIGKRPQNGSFESVGKILHFYSHYYTYIPEAFNGDFDLYAQQMPEYLFVDAYASRFGDNKFVMPLSKDAFKYYHFSLKEHNQDQLLIAYTPKKKNKKLLSGTILFNPCNHKIQCIVLEGHTSFSIFHISLYFQNQSDSNFLPNQVILEMSHDVLGNKIDQKIEAILDYKKVVKTPLDKVPKERMGIIDYLEFSTDSINFITDSIYWKRKRKIGKEKVVDFNKNKTLNIETDTSQEEDPFNALQITEKIISPKKWNKKNTKFNYSGILSPSLIGYSGVNGFSYRQQIRISHVFKNAHLFICQPEIEYQSKFKYLLYRLFLGYEYKPERMGMISFNVVKDNALYSFPNPLDHQSYLDFKYNFYEIANRIELINGLLFKSRFQYRHWKNSRYTTNDFLPEINISYTPEQHYWMNGRYKEYLNSSYPTLGLTLAYAIPGNKRLSSHYWQMESEIYQRIQIDLSRFFNYYIGIGRMWNLGSYRPSDFRNFNLRYPASIWQDKNGRLFNNLGHGYYYVPRRYIQTQFRIDGELLLLSNLNWAIQKYIYSEQLIYSLLHTKEKPFYSELGYGLTNDWFNLTMVLGFDKWRYESFGLRFKFYFL